METTFLATVIGWYLVVMSLLLIFKHEHLKSVLSDVVGHRGVFFTMSLFTFIIGLLIVNAHNVWTKEWTVAITIFGWILLLSGLCRLICTDAARDSSKSFLKNTAAMKTAGVFFLIVGVYLLNNVHHYFKF